MSFTNLEGLSGENAGSGRPATQFAVLPTLLNAQWLASIQSDIHQTLSIYYVLGTVFSITSTKECSKYHSFSLSLQSSLALLD